ncbi:MAG TPA: TraR/DksA family transcriptional regulator [Planctomycetes bacterium]|nr:TraR/DksA family transcriptional regulator [Planctomycetota bacterium]HIN80397.1 TraR/DksA family transcriptional regulator [Planctomycetota bacterium]
MANKYKKKDLEGFRRILLQQRNLIAGNLSSLDSGEDQGGNSGDEADISSGNAESEFTLSMLSSETNIVQKIDKALARLDARSFGVCENCQELIPEARLKAIPWTVFCVDCQRKAEQS